MLSIPHFPPTHRLLLAAHSTASLRNDEDVQATLLNALLRNYFNSGAYDQADKLLSKTTFPESAGNPQLARYLFYLGKSGRRSLIPTGRLAC